MRTNRVNEMADDSCECGSWLIRWRSGGASSVAIHCCARNRKQLVSGAEPVQSWYIIPPGGESPFPLFSLFKLIR